MAGLVSVSASASVNQRPSNGFALSASGTAAENLCPCTYSGRSPTCQICGIVDTAHRANMFEGQALFAQGEKVSGAGGTFLFGMTRRSEPDEYQTIRVWIAQTGFYRWEAVEAYQNQGVQFIISARKKSRLVDELKAAGWQRSPRTDADG